MTHTPEQLAEHLRTLNEVWVEVPPKGYAATANAIRIAAEDVVREEWKAAMAASPSLPDTLPRRDRLRGTWLKIMDADDPLAAAVEAAVRLRRKV